ncbi:hypothetical protein AB0M20_39270, partial [Actinoplanes sp. NPDC051633]|uniref:hypothetical protein n=1 Tax=Actinoplanes sp. NPDC051633 TaxID=3155670 RepID=UPI003437410D
MPVALVAGRLIYMRSQGNQSIRVCTEANVRGQWAYEFWLDAGRHVSPSQVESFTEVADLVEWLVHRGARSQATGNPAPGTAGQVDFALRIAPDADWLNAARPAVECSINVLVEEFANHPYLHRVEHSLHVRLAELLSAYDIFRARPRIGDSSYTTQLIH